MAYKLYNEITPVSYKVQLVRFTYRDSLQRGKKISAWGFLIEDDKEFVQRTNLKESELMGQPYEKFNTFHEKINAVFQFMINNTDWDITMLRNLKLMEQEDGKLVPLPYDFDFSTFVRAPYRRPNQDVGQSVKMERVYMGKVATGREMIPISVYFRSKKNALINKILDFNLLYPEIQSEMVQYLEEFFELIKDNDGLERVYFPKKVTSQ